MVKKKSNEELTTDLKNIESKIKTLEKFMNDEKKQKDMRVEKLETTSKEFDNLIKLMKSFPEKKGQTLQERRLDFEERAKLLPVAEGTQSERIIVGDINAEWVFPKKAHESSVILYVHGGGYCVGSVNTHRCIASYIANASRAKILLMDYRLAPEHPFPAAIEDVVHVYRWLLTQGFSNKHIVIAGDSAGGGITVSTLLYLKQTGDSLPAAAVCLSPWVDMEMTGESHKAKADVDAIIEKGVLEQMAKAYAGDSSPNDPFISPIHSDLSGLPPMLIQAGTAEVLLDDAKRLAQATGEALMTASFEVQDTHLYTDLKLVHERLLKLMAQHAYLVDGESDASNRFEKL